MGALHLGGEEVRRRLLDHPALQVEDEDRGGIDVDAGTVAKQGRQQHRARVDHDGDDREDGQQDEEYALHERRKSRPLARLESRSLAPPAHFG